MNGWSGRRLLQKVNKQVNIEHSTTAAQLKFLKRKRKTASKKAIHNRVIFFQSVDVMSPS